MLSKAVVSTLWLDGANWTLPGPSGAMWPQRNGSALRPMCLGHLGRSWLRVRVFEQLPQRELWQGRHRLPLGLPTQGAQPLPVKWELSLPLSAWGSHSSVRPAAPHVCTG